MIKLARRPPIVFPVWVVMVLAFTLANPFCCHLLPVFDGFETSLPAQMDEVQQLCAGKPLKTVASVAPLVAGGVKTVVAVLPLAESRSPAAGMLDRATVVWKSHGPPRHLVLGMLRI